MHPVSDSLSFKVVNFLLMSLDPLFLLLSLVHVYDIQRLYSLRVVGVKRGRELKITQKYSVHVLLPKMNAIVMHSKHI